MNGMFIQWAVGVLVPITILIGAWVGTIQTTVNSNAKDVQKIEKIKEDIAKIDERTKIILEELRRR